MTKKFAVIILCALFSMCFFVSCGSDDEEDIVSNTDQNGNENGENGSNNGDNGTNNGENGGNTDTGTDSGTDSGADTAADTGSDTGTDTGADTGSDSGDSGTDTGADSGADSGDSGTDTGADSGADSGDSGTDTGADSGADTGDDGNLSNSDANQTAQSGKIGAACTSDSQCKQTYGSGDDEQKANCLFESSNGFPGGYCSFLTTGYEEGACNSTGEVFYNFGNSPDSISSSGNGLCLHRCTKPSDCRKGYRCSNKIHACLPNCKVAGYECMYGKCDETEGVCLKY